MAWEENKHPRDENGQFTSKENEGSGGGEDKTEYKGAKIEKLTKLNGEEVYQFGTEDGDVLTFKSLDEAKEYVDKNRDDFDNDNDFELWDNDISDEDVMQELADGDYYYGGLGEQEIYNSVAERLNITPEKAEQALKNQGFDYQEYQNYIEGIDDFDKEFSEAIKNNHEQIKNDVVKKYNDYKQQGLSDKEIKNKISKEYEEKSGIAWLDGETIDKYRKYSDNNKQSSSQMNDIDYDTVEYPKGTSKEYSMVVNNKYKNALPILKEAGIKLSDFGGKPSAEGGYEDNAREIMEKYVFEPFRKKYPEGNNEVWEKEYQPLYDAIESVTDKNYNDWYIKNKTSQPKKTDYDDLPF